MDSVIAYQEVPDSHVEYDQYEIRINDSKYPIFGINTGCSISHGQVVPATAKIRFLWQVMPGEAAFHIGVAEWSKDGEHSTWMVSFLADPVPLD